MQMGDADSSQAPGPNPYCQGSMNVHNGEVVGVTVTLYQTFEPVTYLGHL